MVSPNASADLPSDCIALHVAVAGVAVAGVAVAGGSGVVLCTGALQIKRQRVADGGLTKLINELRLHEFQHGHPPAPFAAAAVAGGSGGGGRGYGGARDGGGGWGGAAESGTAASGQGEEARSAAVLSSIGGGGVVRKRRARVRHYTDAELASLLKGAE